MSEHLTLLARATITGAAESSSNPATAILSDGSFFVAIVSDNINNPPVYGGLITMWHLDSDLNVLGTAQLPHPTSPDYPHAGSYIPPYAVALTNNRVMLFMRTDPPPAYYAAYPNPNQLTPWFSIVDCSGSDPVPGAETTLASDFLPIYDTYGVGPICIRDDAHDMFFLGLRNGRWREPDNSRSDGLAIQVFRLSTGQLLSEATAPKTSRWHQPTGFWRSDADPTKFSVMDDDTVSPNYTPYRYEFTVSPDGLTATYDGAFEVPYPPDDPYTGNGYSFPTAVGSPYAPYRQYVLDEQDPNFTLYEQGIEKATVQFSVSFGAGSGGPRWNASSGFTALRGQYSLSVQEIHAYAVYVPALPGYPYGGGSLGMWAQQLVLIDQLADPAVIEYLNIPHFDVLGYSDWHLGGYTSETIAPYYAMIPDDYSPGSNGGDCSIAADQGSGVILVAANIYTVTPNMLQVWKIQGPPGSDPNLSGEHLATDVRYYPR